MAVIFLGEMRVWGVVRVGKVGGGRSTQVFEARRWWRTELENAMYFRAVSI